MAKKEGGSFPGIPTRALLEVIGTTLRDAAMVKEAGLPLPEFKDPQKSKRPVSQTFFLSTAGLGEYLRVSSEISQMAADLRRQKDQGRRPNPEP